MPNTRLCQNVHEEKACKLPNNHVVEVVMNHAWIATPMKLLSTLCSLIIQAVSDTLH